MALNQLFKKHTIKGKSIYVVDDHHKVLAAWSLVRRSMSKAPNLITLDHHTDTHEAFLGYAHWESLDGRTLDTEALRHHLVTQIDWRSDQSIVEAVTKLKYDEHIDAATCSGTLHNAFCIQLSDSTGTPSIEEIAYDKSMADNWPKPPSLDVPQRPMTYASATNNIYPIPFECFVACREKSHNNDCLLRQSNEIIETKYLEDQLARGSEISRCIGLDDLEAAPFILDIDLDVFHTRKAITPKDPATFYRLIRNAAAITIATEAECVDEEWLDDDPMSADDLLQAMLIHIDKAM